jgi:hypothetical protein
LIGGRGARLPGQQWGAVQRGGDGLDEQPGRGAALSEEPGTASRGMRLGREGLRERTTGEWNIVDAEVDA